MNKYDVVIIGSGPGGYTSAIRAAQLGLKVGIIEKDAVGGTCLNYGCIPTKAVLSGIQLEKHSDYASIILKKDKIVSQLRDGIISLFKKNKIALIKGRACLIDSDTVEIEDGKQRHKLKTKNIIVATGAYPRPVKNIPFDGAAVFSSQQILSKKKPPKEILIIGGGPEGCEFATIFNLLGTKVSLVEKMDRLLPGEDADISKRLEGYFKRSGIEVGTSKGLSESLKDTKAECILVCIGRIPNVKDLGLDESGIRTEGGCIKVDDYLRTSLPNIYAIGDVIGSGLAHVASYEGMAAVENIIGRYRKRDYRVVPNCIFTSPEVASVGLTEDKAKAEDRLYKAVKFPYSALGVSHCAGKTEGFAKLLGDIQTGKLLGGCIIGYQAVTLIHTLAFAMRLGASMRDLADTITAHPTFPEVLKEAAASFYGEAIHSVV